MDKVRSNWYKMVMCTLFLVLSVAAPSGLLRAEECTIDVPYSIVACIDLKSLKAIFAVLESKSEPGPTMEFLNKTYRRSGKCVELFRGDDVELIKRGNDGFALVKKQGFELWTLQHTVRCGR